MANKKEAAAHAAKMLAMVVRWRNSGLTQLTFSRQEGIKPHIIGYWIRKSEASPAIGQTGSFVEVATASKLDVSAEKNTYEIVFPSTVRLRIPDNFSRDSLQALVSILSEQN